MLLGVPRFSLGITSSSKGLVQGNLFIRQGVEGSWMDCQNPKAIPGDQSAIQDFEFDTKARQTFASLDHGSKSF